MMATPWVRSVPFALVGLAVFLGLGGAPRGMALPEVKNETLATVLGNLQVLADATHPQSPAIHARLFLVVDHGECDGTPQSCPQSRLYLTASEYGEYPEQRVYELPKHHNWRFVTWKHLPKSDGPEDYAVVELSFQTPSPNPEKEWWVDRKVYIRFNYHDAEFMEP